ncbi:hypothetical protein C0Q70_13518 [Pomacea canaliculata]|uniref:Uncharacterized protein n=1 Tax=Pomacea canaliculata TaxID=400727 RepID=A0A2T7NXH0_POMCA|nr:hypothetical protein C0Q70_13518 [Pomacea canaliculata]
MTRESITCEKLGVTKAAAGVPQRAAEKDCNRTLLTDLQNPRGTLKTNVSTDDSIQRHRTTQPPLAQEATTTTTTPPRPPGSTRMPGTISSSVESAAQANPSPLAPPHHISLLLPTPTDLGKEGVARQPPSRHLAVSGNGQCQSMPMPAGLSQSMACPGRFGVTEVSSSERHGRVLGAKRQATSAPIPKCPCSKL